MSSICDTDKSAERAEVPQLHFATPKAGWLPVEVEWHEAVYKMWASPTLTDSLFDFITWMEAILLGALPTYWALNEEERQHYFLAEPMEQGFIRLTFYEMISFESKFVDVRDSADLYTIRTVVSAQELVRAWSASFRHFLATDFDVKEWDVDLRHIDFSRLDALLAGQRQTEWYSEYEPLEQRALVLLSAAVAAEQGRGNSGSKP